MKLDRLNRIIRKMEERELSQMLICDPYSIFYLTGKWVETGERLLALYISTSGAEYSCLFFNRIFSVPEDLGVEKISFSDKDDPVDLLTKSIDSTAVLGIDKNMPARFLLPLMDRRSAAGYCNASRCVDEVRARKDLEEQKLMRAVSAVNDHAMAAFRELLRENVTERQIADQLLEIYRAGGADGFAFPPTVDFAGDAAISHHAVGNTALRPGDCALLDVGCKKKRYCADMTRTFFLREISPEHEKIYELVRKANLAAEAEIRPGARMCDIDRAARQVIEEGGYGKNFTHRLGHFIGLEVHEFGDVSGSNTAIAEPGNVFSVEPGIYIPGEIGVRIEDLVLVTDDGCEILNHYPKQLQVVG